MRVTKLCVRESCVRVCVCERVVCVCDNVVCEGVVCVCDNVVGDKMCERVACSELNQLHWLTQLMPVVFSGRICRSITKIHENPQGSQDMFPKNYCPNSSDMF